MSARYDADQGKAEMAYAAMLELVERYQHWLTVDNAVPLVVTPEQAAECLAVTHLFTVAKRRRGMPGVAGLARYVQGLVAGITQ